MKGINTLKYVLLAIFLASLLGFGYSVYQANYSQMSGQVKHSLGLEAKAHADYINAKLDDLKGDLSILQAMPPIVGIQRALLNGNLDPIDPSTTSMWQTRLNSIFRSYLLTQPNVIQIRYVDVRHDWQVLVSVEQPGQDKLRLKADVQKEFVQRLLNLDSNAVLVSGVAKIADDVSTYRIQMAKKVFDADGVLFGVLLMNIELQTLLDSLAASVNPSIGLHVLDSDNDLLLSKAEAPAEGSALPDKMVDFLTSSSFLHGQAKVSLGDSDHLSIVLADQDHDARLYSYIDAATAVISLFVLAVIFLIIFYLQRRNAKQQSALIINESKNIAIIKNSQDAIIGYSTNGVINSWNSSAEHMFGYSSEEVIGKKNIDLIWSLGRKDEEAEALNRLLSGQVSKPVEGIRKHRSGNDIAVSLSASAILDERDEIIGISEIIRDITEQKNIAQELSDLNQSLQKQVEERTRELQESYSLQETILSIGENMVIATDINGVITHFNPAAESLLGYAKEEMVGKFTPAIFHDEAEVIARAEELSIELNRPIEPGFDVFVVKTRLGLKNDHEWTYVTREGTRVPVFLCVSAFCNEQGEITGYLGMATDITELMDQRQQLVAFKDQLTKASEIANLGIWSWDLSDNSIYWNPKMFEIYDMDGATAAEFDAWLNMVVEEDRERALSHFERLVSDGSEADIVFDVITPAGKRKTIHATGSLETSNYHNKITVIGINKDVSQQVSYENALKEAKEAADLASRTKSEFVANMSHEIRTPLNAIMGTIELMRRTTLTRKQQDYIDRSDNAAKSLLAILNDILDFSKIEAGRMALDPQPFCLADMVEVLVSILIGNKSNKAIELIVDLDPKLPYEMVLDSLRLQQIILNLAGNALKFTHQGQVVLRFKAGHGDRLLIEVIDTGIGIEPDKQKCLFQPFIQAQSSTVREYGGTGLGLVISRRLVELMGGTMIFHSAPGEGTEFNVSIPYQIASGDFLLNDPLISYRVLILDANKDARAAALNAVEMLGWDAILATTLNELWWQLESSYDNGSPFDIVLIDKGALAGQEFSLVTIQKQLGKDGFTGKVVILSSDEHEGIDEATFYLRKPVTAKRLTKFVNDVFLVSDDEPDTVKEHHLPLTGLKLLLAEDNTTNQLIAKELLQSEGASVVIANNGVEAVERFNEQKFDLVLMDIQMPVMDGYDAAKAIRSRSTKTPIIAMTANALKSDLELAEAAGMDAHISKPFQVEQLVLMILQVTQSTVLESRLVSKTDDASNPLPAQIVNQHGALVRMGGNQALYASTLDVFLRESAELMENIPCELSGSDEELPAIIRSAHSLKGAAAAIGAEQLALMAEQLERQLKAHDFSDYIKLTRQLGERYKEAVVAIREIGTQSDAVLLKHEVTDDSATDGSIEQLIELLENSNMRAISVYESMLSEAKPGVVVALEQIKGAMQALDFKAAASELTNYIKGSK